MPPNDTYTGTGRRGRSAELFLASVLMDRRFKVFQPMVDNEGVDLLASNPAGSPLRIQSKQRDPESGTVHQLTIPKDRRLRELTHVYLHRGGIPPDEWWVVPFSDYLRLSYGETPAYSRGKPRKHRRQVRLNLSKRVRKAPCGFLKLRPSLS